MLLIKQFNPCIRRNKTERLYKKGKEKVNEMLDLLDILKTINFIRTGAKKTDLELSSDEALPYVRKLEPRDQDFYRVR